MTIDEIKKKYAMDAVDRSTRTFDMEQLLRVKQQTQKWLEQSRTLGEKENVAYFEKSLKRIDKKIEKLKEQMKSNPNKKTIRSTRF